jgi:AcrR family transcriptional regulator
MSPLDQTGHPGRMSLGVREACVQEALAIISADGLDRLSLREVARRLEISHQAPYKHFANREELLAEVMSRAFDDFAAHLNERPPTSDPREDLGEIGRRYLRYAELKPLQFRLMFETPLPDLRRHPDLARKSTEAFGLLHEAVRRLRGETTSEHTRELALFAWSTVHGLASVTANGALPALEINGAAAQGNAVDHVLAMICGTIERA